MQKPGTPSDARYSPLLENDNPPPDRPPQDGVRLRSIKVVELKGGQAVTKHIEKNTLEKLRVLDEDGSLVRQFWYKQNDEEGTVWYKHPQEDNSNDVLYARLVGVNAWADDVCKCLLNVSLLVSKTMAQAQFLSVLLTSDKYEDTDQRLVILFAAIFLAGSSLWVLVALYCTLAKMKALALAGDHIQNAGFGIKARYFVSQLIFQMFNVPDSVVEAPVRFHPRKAVQPFAVLKIDGARFWVLGFPTLGQYHSQNNVGALTQLPATVFLTIPLVVVQFMIGGFDISACVSLVLSVVSVLLRGWDICILIGHRREFYRNLTQSVAGGLEGCNNEEEKRHLLIHHKLLLENFRVKVPAELSEEFKKQFGDSAPTGLA